MDDTRDLIEHEIEFHEKWLAEIIDGKHDDELGIEKRKTLDQIGAVILELKTILVLLDERADG